MKRRYTFSIFLCSLAVPIGLFSLLMIYGVTSFIQYSIDDRYDRYNDLFHNSTRSWEICKKEGFWKKECILDRVIPFIAYGFQGFYQFLNDWNLEPLPDITLVMILSLPTFFITISLISLSLVSLCKCLCSSIILVVGLIIVYVSSSLFTVILVVYWMTRPSIALLILMLCNPPILFGIPIGVFLIPKWKMFRSKTKIEHKHVKLELIQTE